MTRKQALGRGLAALLPAAEERPRLAGAEQVEIGRLSPGHFQPRRQYSEATLAELAASIKEHGVVQPILVSRRGEKLEIVAGERRWRAAAIAGLERVPVIYREVTDRERLELALVENLQREDLNALEAAEAYARLREEFHLSQESIAERVGKDRTTIANALRLLKLPSPVRQMIREGSLSAGHARALLALSSPDEQEKLANEVLRRALSVRQTEARAASLARGPQVRHERRRDPFSRDAEEKLSRRLHAKVRIVRRRRGGEIQIRFGSEEELIGLYERLGRSGDRKGPR
jgi:ParB family chromosome partitioning protein